MLVNVEAQQRLKLCTTPKDGRSQFLQETLTFPELTLGSLSSNGSVETNLSQFQPRYTALKPSDVMGVKWGCEIINDEKMMFHVFESSQNCQSSGFDYKKILGEGCARSAPWSETYVRVCTKRWQEAKLLQQ
eukprot:scaffold5529_cov117-Cylindrotheca_fusiformis.AAC.16